MSTDKVSPNRMSAYKSLSTAFRYPEDEDLQLEYDRLFRLNNIWLYGAEYTSENEFQMVKSLSDIMGFYKAFGVTPDSTRPDSLETELEFMHYLIFKEINAPDTEKASICRDAQKKFFNEHLCPAAKKIAERIIAKDSSYKNRAKELLEFIQCESQLLS